MNEYYVYVWIREDYNTVFYIGKGKNQKYTSRAERIKNNIHFKRIYEKVPTHYEIIHNNLTEQEALDLERKTIHYYVYELGYSIQVPTYEEKEIKGKHLTNCTWGGEGVSGYKHTDEEKRKCANFGEKNPNYGKKGELHQCYGKPKTNSHKEKIMLSNPRCKGVYCIELDRTFRSFREASRILKEEYGIKCSHASISANCSGKSTSCGEFIDTKEKANLHFIIITPTTTERVELSNEGMQQSEHTL